MLLPFSLLLLTQLTVPPLLQSQNLSFFEAEKCLQWPATKRPLTLEYVVLRIPFHHQWNHLLTCSKILASEVTIILKTHSIAKGITKNTHTEGRYLIDRKIRKSWFLSDGFGLYFICNLGLIICLIFEVREGGISETPQVIKHKEQNYASDSAHSHL